MSPNAYLSGVPFDVKTTRVSKSHLEAVARRLCRAVMKTCSAPGCAKPGTGGRGWCHMHYARWRNGRDFLAPRDLRRTPPRQCAIEGCTENAVGRGWCKFHYQRWRRRGNPLETLRPNLGSKRSLDSDGYWRVFEPGHPLAQRTGWVLEHRKVAWDHGILTDPSQTVHHINHVKTDNRPENLRALGWSEHSRLHVGATVTNQFGTWPVLDGEKRRKHRRDLENSRRRRRTKLKRMAIATALFYVGLSPAWGPAAEGAFRLEHADPKWEGIAAVDVSGLVTAPRDVLPPAPRPRVYRPTSQPVRLPTASTGRCGGDLPPCWVMMRESRGDVNAFNPSGCSGRGCYGKWQCDPRTCDGTGSEAEQDAEARRVWDNGRGCSHWNAC